MKSSLFEKIRSVVKITLSGDFKRLTEQLTRYARHKLKDQWEFVYFELPLDEAIFSIKMRENVLIRSAVQSDISRIESQIYPFVGSNEKNDKRYISLIGRKGIRCFVAEKDDKLIHYCWAFDRALESPLMNTPFDKTKVLDEDAYLGPAFTNPNVRGTWIFPYSLSKICEYIKNNTDATRVLLFVHKDNPGAVGFYRRLGFREIVNACPSGPVAAVKQKLVRLWK